MAGVITDSQHDVVIRHFSYPKFIYHELHSAVIYDSVYKIDTGYPVYGCLDQSYPIRP